jgi:C_GCAxxG_C_C family probable redox protein
VASFAPEFGLEREKALKVSCALGAGFGRIGETCGVVTGGLAVIGLAQGNGTAEDKAAKEKSYESARRFFLLFKERNGATDCRDLIGCDISTPEGFVQAKENGVFAGCRKFVQSGAELLEEMLFPAGDTNA